MTQTELAKRAHILQSDLSHLEAGRRGPSVSRLKDIAEALDKPVSYFLEGG